MIDLFMVGVSTQECFIPRSSPMLAGLLSYTAIIPGIIRQMPATVKEKEGREGRDRQSRLLASTATTWPIRSPKVSSTLTDLSTGSSLGQSLSHSLPPKIFGFLWNLLSKCIRWAAHSQVNRENRCFESGSGSQLVKIFDG